MRGNEWQYKQRREREQRWRPQRRDGKKQSREYVIVLDNREEEGKESDDLTGGLSRLPLFVIQHAAAMWWAVWRGWRAGPALSSLPLLCLFLASSLFLPLFSSLPLWLRPSIRRLLAIWLQSRTVSDFACLPAWLAGSTQARLPCITQCRWTLSPNWER